MATIAPTDPAATTDFPVPTPAVLHVPRQLIADALAAHHAVTVHLGGDLYVWVCTCGAPDTSRALQKCPDGRLRATAGATTHDTAYSRARAHTAQAVLDALTRAGLL